MPWHLRDGKKKQPAATSGGKPVTTTEFSMDTSTDIVVSEPENVHVFHRYYHVFQEGELEALCREVANTEIASSYYDQGNWCVILTKSQTAGK